MSDTQNKPSTEDAKLKQEVQAPQEENTVQNDAKTEELEQSVSDLVSNEGTTEASPSPEEAEKELTQSKEEQDIQEKTAAEAETEDLKTENSEETDSKESEEEVIPTSIEDGDTELESEDDTEEVQSDDEHEDEHPDELEMPDYAEFSAEDLVKTADKLLKDHPIQRLKDHFEAIRKNLLLHLNEERDERLEKFIENGGNAIDFELVQPLREQFRTIYRQYRDRRRKYYQELSDRLDNNLKIKLGLIDQLKEIVNKEESIGETFKEFNAIIQEWRNTGPVPRLESANLWRTYHHHVENFYEFIKINKELRDLDYKKNREAKQELIDKAKTLLAQEDAPQAFRELQKLHKEWKHIGPVERENREAMWEEFSGITKELRDKRELFFDKLRERRDELIREKRDIVGQMAAIPTDYQRHKQWQEAIQKINELGEAFKKIGRLNHPENDSVWEAYREAQRNFNRAKNNFYKEQKKEHLANLKLKKDLLEKAESLKNSENWRETANALKKLQADWKKIGHVPKSESDKIWKQFRGACNHFFDRLTEHNKAKDAAFVDNQKAKEALLEKMEKTELDVSDKKQALKEIKSFINEWKQIGLVPRKAKDQLEKAFTKKIDGFFEAIDMNRREAQRMRFENKIESIAEHGGNREMRSEKNHLQRKVEEAQKELNQLETNMSFFRNSNPKSPIVMEAQKKIDEQKRHIDALKEQQKMLNIKLHEMVKEESADQNKEEGETSEP
jgi:hypothetical protein